MKALSPLLTAIGAFALVPQPGVAAEGPFLRNDPGKKNEAATEEDEHQDRHLRSTKHQAHRHTAELLGNDIFGSVITESTLSFEDTVAALTGALSGVTGLVSTYPEFDFAQMAADEGLPALFQNKIFTFGLPEQDTALLQQAPYAGLDLPLKMMVWKSNATTFIAYNPIEYLQTRYPNLDHVASEVITEVNGILETLASTAAGDIDPDEFSRPTVDELERLEKKESAGVYVKKSKSDFDSTWARLEQTLADRDTTDYFTIDHQANAGTIETKIAPNRCAVFAPSPQALVKFVRLSPTAALDMPLKVCVVEETTTSTTDEGEEASNTEVHVVTNRIKGYMRLRHGMPQQQTDEPRKEVQDLVNSIIEVAAGQTLPKRAQGMVLVESEYRFDKTYDEAKEAITSAGYTIVDEIDHSGQAANAGLELPPSKLIVFRNAALESPILEADPLAGLDLPLKILIWQQDNNTNGTVFLGFNPVQFYRTKYTDIPALPQIKSDLKSIASTATNKAPTTFNRPDEADIDEIRKRGKNQFELRESTTDFESTWARLLRFIQLSPASVFFTVDFFEESNQALSNKLRLVAFGHPEIGTSVMQSAPSAGIDLPIKILVSEDADGNVTIASPPADSLRIRHRGGSREQIQAVQNALDNFLDAAVGNKIPHRPLGMVIAPSTNDFNTTYALLIQAIADNEATTLVQTVDHAAINEEFGRRGITLFPNTVVFFSTGSNPIMENNALASLDYPQRILIWQDKNGDAFVGYNSREFLAARYGDDAGSGSGQFMADLALAATSAAEEAILTPSEGEVAERYQQGSGILQKKSRTNFASTWNRLKMAIEQSRLGPDISFQLDNNSENVKAYVATIGFADSSAMLLLKSPTMGLDLPLKISVTENENGQVQVATNRRGFLLKRHDLGVTKDVKDAFREEAVRLFIDEATGKFLPDRSAGMILAQSAIPSAAESAEKTYANLKTALLEQSGTIVAEVDNTPEKDKTAFNKAIFVSFPEVDNPLLTAYPRAALDLPLAVSVFQEYGDPGKVFVTFNSPRYIESRYDVNVDAAIKAWRDAVLKRLEAAVSAATNTNKNAFVRPVSGELLPIRENPGFLTRSISDDFDQFDAIGTRLLNALNTSSLENVFDVEGDTSNGDVDTRYRVIGFRVGHKIEGRLLGVSKALGLDLPFKVMIIGNAEDGVSIVTNAVSFLRRRHNLEGQLKRRWDKLDGIIETILSETVAPPIAS